MTVPVASPADAAWVVIEAPLPASALAAFCADLEKLYRINPYLEFSSWRETGHGTAVAAFRNLSNQREYKVSLTVKRSSEKEFLVSYDSGIKHSTRFEIEGTPSGSRLRITDEYVVSESIDPAEVDRSQHAWGVALRGYLLDERRWGWCPLWQWYMRRVWIPMKPTARRITFVILAITVAEIALISLVFAIYWIEYRS